MKTHTKILSGLAVLATVTVSAVPTSYAQGRPDTRYMPCGQIISLVRSRGAVLLSTGAHTYNKYVANHAYCAIDQELVRAYVPSADHRRCKVGFICKEKIFD